MLTILALTSHRQTWRLQMWKYIPTEESVHTTESVVSLKVLVTQGVETPQVTYKVVCVDFKFQESLENTANVSSKYRRTWKKKTIYDCWKKGFGEREVKKRRKNEDRCDERLKTKEEEST
jgi:hypothetical protein